MCVCINTHFMYISTQADFILFFCFIKFYGISGLDPFFFTVSFIYNFLAVCRFSLVSVFFILLNFSFKAQTLTYAICHFLLSFFSFCFKAKNIILFSNIFNGKTKCESTYIHLESCLVPFGLCCFGFSIYKWTRINFVSVCVGIRYTSAELPVYLYAYKQNKIVSVYYYYVPVPCQFSAFNPHRILLPLTSINIQIFSFSFIFSVFR